MSVLAFVLGIYFSIRVIAALYGILDLWYTIRTAYPRVLGAILGWGLIAAALAWALPGTAFLWGFGAYWLFFLSMYVIRYPIFWALRRRPSA